MSIMDGRSVGDQTPFSLTVNLGETINLSGATLTFRLTSLDLQTVKVDDATGVEATDVTEEAGATTAPALSIWRLDYEPGATDVDTKGDYLGQFKAQFAGGVLRFYPPGGEFIHVEVRDS